MSVRGRVGESVRLGVESLERLMDDVSGSRYNLDEFQPSTLNLFFELASISRKLLETGFDWIPVLVDRSLQQQQTQPIARLLADQEAFGKAFVAYEHTLKNLMMLAEEEEKLKLKNLPTDDIDQAATSSDREDQRFNELLGLLDSPNPVREAHPRRAGYMDLEFAADAREHTPARGSMVAELGAGDSVEGEHISNYPAKIHHQHHHESCEVQDTCGQHQHDQTHQEDHQAKDHLQKREYSRQKGQADHAHKFVDIQQVRHANSFAQESRPNKDIRPDSLCSHCRERGQAPEVQKIPYKTIAVRCWLKNCPQVIHLHCLDIGSLAFEHKYRIQEIRRDWTVAQLDAFKLRWGLFCQGEASLIRPKNLSASFKRLASSTQVDPDEYLQIDCEVSKRAFEGTEGMRADTANSGADELGANVPESSGTAPRKH